MTGIRFLQTDHLRLGSPLTGLCDCPEWLRNTAAGAVRRSVAGMLESAIAEKCHFVLISGRITERTEDWNAAMQWLTPLLVRLERSGIPVVMTADALGHEISEKWSTPALRFSSSSEFRPLVLNTAERLEVTFSPGTDKPQLRVVPPSGVVTDSFSLTLSVASSRETLHARPHEHRSGLSYVAVPGITPDSEGRVMSINGAIWMTAGAPQAISPEERGAFGGRIVDVDLTDRSVTTQITSTDTIRYARESLEYHIGQSAESVRNEILERSHSYRMNSGRTIILEWIIDSRIPAAGSMEFGNLSSRVSTFPYSGIGPRPASFSQWLAEFPFGLQDESSVLTELRTRLESGHRGVWPGRIRFRSSAMVYSDSGIRAA
jgi:hypothetical protein